MRFGNAVAATVLVAVACAGGGSGGPSETVVVSAASSLGEVFTAMESTFEATHPGIDVVVNTAASSTLERQILSGAPVDVFAPADERHLEDLLAAGLAHRPSVFATNHLVIAVPEGNPGGVTGPRDLTRPELLVGLCVADAPCGDLARTALTRIGVVPDIDTEEPNVRSLFTKIEAGEIDAGIVYETDVVSSAGTVEWMRLSPEADVLAAYWIAAVTDPPGPSVAEFIAFVLSSEGRDLLDEYGFGSP